MCTPLWDFKPLGYRIVDTIHGSDSQQAFILRSSLVRFFEQQAIYIVLTVIVSAIFWANGQPVHPATILVYALAIGNLLVPITNQLRVVYRDRPFPYNWLAFLAVLLLLTPPIYLISSIVVWWIAPPNTQPLRDWIITGWKFPSIVTIVFGIVSFVYRTTKERLEARNIELQRTVEQGAAQLEMQEQELERAREIQQSLLPKDIPQLPAFDIATAWRPARAVGGDYFDVLRLSENRIAICIADVVGKGISAALLMANVQATVRAFARDSDSPARVCSRVNSVLCGNIAAEKFVTFFYGILDAEKRTLQYCNAGHLAPVLVSCKSARQLPGGGAVLGVFPAWKYEDLAVDLAAGDRLLLYTDGITEAAGQDGSEFGEESLLDVAKANLTAPASYLNAAVLARVTEFCGGHFHDDATLLAVAVS